VFRHHRQGALADGAGGTKNSQALHGADLPSFITTRAPASLPITGPQGSLLIYRLSYES
jgi:hypothetical protein